MQEKHLKMFDMLYSFFNDHSSLKGSGVKRYDKIPSNSIPIDQRRLATVTSGTDKEVFLQFTVPTGYVAFIYAYGLFSDAQFASDVEFIPEVDGVRVMKYHGTPDSSNWKRLPYRMSLATGLSLGESDLIETSIQLGEGQTFTWKLTNTAGVDQDMGIRFKGYMTTAESVKTRSLGGN